MSKEKLVKLIEEKNDRKFACEEVFTKKKLKAIAKRRGITKYSRLGRAALAEKVKKDIENAPVEEEIRVVDRRDALKGVFGTVRIEEIEQHDLETFFQVSRSTISRTIEDALTRKKGLKVQLVLKVELVKTNPGTGEHLRRPLLQISPGSHRRISSPRLRDCGHGREDQGKHVKVYA